MMKTILLLAFTVFVSCAPAANTDKTPVRHTNKTLLGELVDELNMAMKDFPKETEEKQVFLKDLQMNVMGHKEHEVFFCQAEQELKTKVSGLSGAEFDHFRFDKKLMRNLNMYNKHHKTCKPADEDLDKIPLRAFLKNLLTSVKSAFSQVK
uniref:Interleukin 13 n=1 Tax=Sinocyclocheilus anshuiensis TaxID=1608454 RepID=A0A671RZR1_9TELE